jgi:phosphate starvation-inducible membrane PsiE
MAIEPTGSDPLPPPPPPPSGSGPSQGMSEIPRGTLVGLIAAGLLLISVFFNWYSATVKFGQFSQSASVSGWDATDVAKLVFLLAAIALIALILEQFAATVELPVPASMIAGVCGIIALLLVVYRIISKPGGEHTGSIQLPGGGSTKDLISFSIGTSWGIWLSLIAAIALIVGAYLSMNESNA